MKTVINLTTNAALALSEAAETIQARDFLPMANGQHIQLQRPLKEIREHLMNKAVAEFCAAVISNGGFARDWTDRCDLRAITAAEDAIEDQLSSIDS